MSKQLAQGCYRTQWNSGATRQSNRGRRVLIPNALTTTPPSHTRLLQLTCTCTSLNVGFYQPLLFCDFPRLSKSERVSKARHTTGHFGDGPGEYRRGVGGRATGIPPFCQITLVPVNVIIPSFPTSNTHMQHIYIRTDSNPTCG